MDWKPTIFLFQSQPRVNLAGVAERFRRQPAELLYVGSIPIPSSTDETKNREFFHGKGYYV
jgi:hypothetical protein